MRMMDNLANNTALLDDWVSPVSTMSERGTHSGSLTVDQRRAIMADHLQAMYSLSSDRRIQYLAEHGLADADIRQLLSAIHQVINRDYGETIRQMAAKHARQDSGLADAMTDIRNSGVIHALAVVCCRTGSETDVIAAAYANHELYYTVNAALNIAKTAQEPAGHGTAYDQQSVARDQMLADVGLSQDARLWPKS